MGTRPRRSSSSVAKGFALTETAVRPWVGRAQVDAGERDALTGREHEEPATSRRENRRLREDVEVLR